MQLYETMMWLLPPSIIAENCWTNVLRIHREAQEGGDRCIITADLHCVWQKPTQPCKAIFLQLKNKLKWRISKFYTCHHNSPILFYDFAVSEHITITLYSFFLIYFLFSK